MSSAETVGTETAGRTSPEETERPTVVTEEKKKDSFIDFLKELPILIFVAFGIALLIKTFLLQAFYIPSGSMENTLLKDDRVLVAKFLYRFTDPAQGDVIVFASPLEASIPKEDHGPVGNFFNNLAEGLGLKSSERDFIKRVIAVEGQTVQIKEGAVFVNNRKLDEPYLHDKMPISCASQQFCGPIKVPTDKVFVMGDNRGNSQDSRVFGPIPESSIVG